MVAAETIYKDSSMHFMLVTPTLMSRAWCLWELAVRKSAKKFTVPIESKSLKFSIGLPNSGNFFQDMQASKEEDLVAIRRKITSVYESAVIFDWDMKLIFRACRCITEVCTINARFDDAMVHRAFVRHTSSILHFKFVKLQAPSYFQSKLCAINCFFLSMASL